MSFHHPDPLAYDAFEDRFMRDFIYNSHLQILMGLTDADLDRLREESLKGSPEEEGSK